MRTTLTEWQPSLFILSILSIFFRYRLRQNREQCHLSSNLSFIQCQHTLLQLRSQVRAICCRKRELLARLFRQFAEFLPDSAHFINRRSVVDQFAATD